MITSEPTSEAQTTTPPAVGAALEPSPGDEIASVIEDGRVSLLKATAGRADDPFAAFTEWDSDADRRNYAGL